MRYLTVLALVGVLVAPALGDDLYPPSWRGAPGSTFQHWTFSYPQGDPSGYPMGPWLPEYANNPYGQPSLYTYFQDEHWYDMYEGRQGVFEPWANTVYIDLPNNPDPNAEKWVYLQMTWWDSTGPGFPFNPYVTPLDGTAYPMSPGQIVDLGGGWWYENWFVSLPFNPAFEQIIFNSDPPMDQIVVDTICIPEPASMLLLAVAGLFLRRR